MIKFSELYETVQSGPKIKFVRIQTNSESDNVRAIFNINGADTQFIAYGKRIKSDGNFERIERVGLTFGFSDNRVITDGVKDKFEKAKLVMWRNGLSINKSSAPSLVTFEKDINKSDYVTRPSNNPAAEKKFVSVMTSIVKEFFKTELNIDSWNYSALPANRIKTKAKETDKSKTSETIPKVAPVSKAKKDDKSSILSRIIKGAGVKLKASGNYASIDSSDFLTRNKLKAELEDMGATFVSRGSNTSQSVYELDDGKTLVKVANSEISVYSK